MTTLRHPQAKQQILDRIARLSVVDKPAWGTMSTAQMVCHLADAYRVALGMQKASAASGVLQRTVLKWAALWAPVKWIKGFPTRPEIEQGKGGTLPADFECDRQALLVLVGRFCEDLPSPCLPHPIFGPLDAHEWARWAYLHADHHLRQFGR